MRTASIPTRTIVGLDYRVWFTVIVTWLLCVGVYGYKKLYGNAFAGRNCQENVAITVNNKAEGVAVCYLDRIAIFQIQPKQTAAVVWDFGDGSADRGSIVQHKYTTEGPYTVTARIDGTCIYTQEITVTSRAPAAAEARNVQIITDSANPKAGTTVRFYAVSDPPPETCEWILVGAKDTQRTPVAAFSFPASGRYKVQLIIDGDRTNPTFKTISVAEIPLPDFNNFPMNGGATGNPIDPGPLMKPGENPFGGGQNTPPQSGGNGNIAPETPKEEPAKPKATGIDPETFKAMLQEVLDEKKDVGELYPYLDYKETTIVKINGNEEMKLPEFCRKKRGKKLETLVFQPDNKGGVQKLLVKFRRRGPFGLW